MNSIAWEEGFSIGHESMDAQHRRMCGLIDQVRGIVHSRIRPDVREAEQVVTDLVHALADHFTFENQLMRDTAYPQEASHRAYHMRMLEAISEVMEHWLVGDDASAAYDDFFHQWYYHHASGADQSFGRWLEAHPE